MLIVHTCKLLEKVPCCCSVAQSCLTVRNPMDCSTPGFPVLHYLPEFAQTHVHWVSDATQPSISSSVILFSFCLQSFPASIRVFSNKSALCIRRRKYWSFSISPSNEYSGLISFQTDCFDLLAVQGTFRSPPAPQFKSINSLVLSFFYGPTLTSIDDNWINHSFDYTDLCQQSNVSAF